MRVNKYWQWYTFNLLGEIAYSKHNIELANKYIDVCRRIEREMLQNELDQVCDCQGIDHILTSDNNV